MGKIGSWPGSPWKSDNKDTVSRRRLRRETFTAKDAEDTKMAEMKFRFAEMGDAESFAQWTSSNRLIDGGDIMAATKEENPTTTYFVIESDGVPVLFVPSYLVQRIGYLGFNPDADKATREAAMEMMLQVLKAFAAEHQIGQIDVLTKSAYPVAEWARAHAFNPDPRELFTLKVPPEGH
jgi:hypothetical protein